VGRTTEDNRYTTNQKIGRRFAETLGRLRPDQKIRAVILLRSHNSVEPMGRRGSSRQRQASIAAVREASEPGLREIDKILERHKGTRLASHADALGSIPVETTPAGFSALAGSDHVKAILEDQPMSLLSLPR
jgi:hypothetical protein